MGKKGRKTRWRKLPIPIGNQGGGGNAGGGGGAEPSDNQHDSDERELHHPRITFNEDEYTKITTPRQDMLFKKGYLSKKRPQPAQQPAQPAQAVDNADSQSADSAESEQYICDEPMQPQYIYPPASYIDHTGVYFLNSSSYEVYDPYTGNVTVIVGPAQYPGGQPLLAAVPCQPVPLQPVEWFNPTPPQWHNSRKKPSSTDSQNYSAPSSESTCPPSSPQEPVEGMDPQGMVYPPQYVYPGYMFGAPLYNVNGVSVQGILPQTGQPADTKQRRKKRRRRRRGGVTDEGSESSCEEHLAGVESGSGASSDAGPPSLCSKTNSDSGVHTDPTPNSGSNSPQPHAAGPPSPPPILSPVSSLDDTSTHARGSLSDDPPLTLTADASDYADYRPSSVSLSHAPTLTDEVLNSNGDVELNEECDTHKELLPEAIEEVSACPPEVAERDAESAKNEEIMTEEVDGAEVVEAIEEPVDRTRKEEAERTPKIEESASETEAVEAPVERTEYKEETVKSTETEEIPFDGAETVEEIVKSTESVEAPVVRTESAEVTAERTQESFSGTKENVDKEEEAEWTIEETEIAEPTITPSVKCTRCQELERLAEKTADEIVEEALIEVGRRRPKESARPITAAVTKWLQSQGVTALTRAGDSSEDEGIDRDSDESTTPTGQKNADGNPFPAPSLSGEGTRVADDSESSAGEWDMYDSHVGAKCDPTISVDKYYRLGAESPTVIKTAVHIRRAGPFPCAVCCLIQ